MTSLTAAAATETDPLVVAVVSVALTLFVGLIVGWVTSSLARRGEHAKWLRESRYEAYVAFMIDMSALAHIIDSKPTADNAKTLLAKIESYRDRSSASLESVSLLGPRKVNKAGQHWTWAASSYMTEKTEANKVGLSSARWEFLKVAGKILKSKNVTNVPMTKPTP